MHSILFVPATRLDLIAKASASNATAICLDLEDGVAPGQKESARTNVREALGTINQSGKKSLLRINADLDDISFDLAVVPESLGYIVLPMTGSRHQIMLLAAWIDRQYGGSAGPKIVAMVEGADGLRGLASENRAIPPRLTHLALGSEDFAASQGCSPSASPIIAAFDQLAHLAAEWNVQLLGYPGSIAEFQDLDAFGQRVRVGSEAGAVGGFAIHPKQVDVLNALFMPLEEDVVRARRVVEAFDMALSEGKGAIQLGGRMIDRPVYLAALRLLARI